jgi:hypothetical protein
VQFEVLTALLLLLVVLLLLFQAERDALLRVT